MCFCNVQIILYLTGKAKYTKYCTNHLLVFDIIIIFHGYHRNPQVCLYEFDSTGTNVDTLSQFDVISLFQSDACLCPRDLGSRSRPRLPHGHLEEAGVLG